jgi:hypothetical protein
MYNGFADISSGLVRLFQLSDFLVNVAKYEYGEKDLQGSGGYGSVYKARVKGKDQMVAIKILHNKLSMPNQEVFLREVEIQAQLRHPAVLPVLAFSLVTSGNKGPAIVTPLMFPKSLRAVLVSEKSEASPGTVQRKNPTRLSKSVFGVASALEYVHSMGVVYGDLKGDNIFFDDDFNPVLGDFGLAQYAVATPRSPAEERPPAVITELHGFDLDINMFSVLLVEIYNTLSWDSAPEFVANLMKRCLGQEKGGRPTFSQIVDELLKNEEWVFKGSDIQKLHEYQEKLKRYRPAKQGSESVEDVVPDQESARDAPMLGLVLGCAAGGVVAVVALVMVVVVIRRRAAKKDEEYHEAPEIQA